MSILLSTLFFLLEVSATGLSEGVPSHFPTSAPSDPATYAPTESSSTQASSSTADISSTSIIPITDLVTDKRSTNEDMSLSNPTFIAFICAVSLLSICIVIGLYLLCCVDPRKGSPLNEQPTFRRELSDLWGRMDYMYASANHTPDLLIRSAAVSESKSKKTMLKECDGSLSVFASLPKMDLFGTPPKKEFEKNDSLSVFANLPNMDLFGVPSEKKGPENRAYVNAASQSEASIQIVDFCNTFKSHINEKAAWVGSMKMSDSEERYLELVVSGKAVNRVVDVEKQRFATPIESLKIYPQKTNSKAWIPAMSYKDIHEETKTTLTLLGKNLDLERLVITGTCIVEKDSNERHGTFRIERMSLPKHGKFNKTDLRRSVMLNSASEVHQRDASFGRKIVFQDIGGSTTSILSEEDCLV